MEITYCIAHADVAALITTADQVVLPRPVDRRAGDHRRCERSGFYEDLGAPRRTVAAHPLPGSRRVCWMPFTSGTSGPPKVAVVREEALIDHWNLVIREFGVRADDTMLIAGPFYHSLGFVFALACLFAGGRVVIHERFDPERALRAIGEHGITVMPAAPAMYSMMTAADGARTADLSSMRAVISAGSPLLTVTKDSLIELFGETVLFEFYGATEMGITAKLSPADQRRKVRCIWSARCRRGTANPRCRCTARCAWRSRRDLETRGDLGAGVFPQRAGNASGTPRRLENRRGRRLGRRRRISVHR